MLVSNNKVLKINNKWLNGHGSSPVPSLPPYTLRLKYKQGTTPTFEEGTGVLVDSTNNIWDLTYENSDWSNLLQSHSDLIEVIDANAAGVVNMESMFSYCYSLETVTLFNTSNVTNMQSMFTGCSLLTTLSLFDTSNVINMVYMFNGCSSLTTVPLFNTSNVINLEGMFYYCNSLITVPLFNTSNATNMYGMFRSCKSLTSVPLFNTYNVTRMTYMFETCNSLTAVPLFDTSKVVNTYCMFYNCNKVQSGALALYQQMSTQATPPTNHDLTFSGCGRDTTTGAAELAQIPSSWGGTGA